MHIIIVFESSVLFYSVNTDIWKLCLKVLWIFKIIFETLHDLNDIDEKTKMLKTPS